MTEGESTLIVLTTIGNRTTESVVVQDLNICEIKGETGLMTSAVLHLTSIRNCNFLCKLEDYFETIGISTTRLTNNIYG